MKWLYLILAGLFEIGFTTSMKFSEGFTKWQGIVGFFIFGGLSFWLLLKSMQSIEMGTAYAVWAGIGASGTVLMGAILFNDSISWTKLLFLFLIIVGIIGIKLSA
ncbi:multidrug efflux SMR transporter [Seonamhaeicola sp.]|uniref:DMT family transporter n=1 Tax=Seonamhaeicola sp. TaxID=1912245 RepID=UPI00261A1D46|nr:multidrug efflux SMR transporter [Seonamhaeicola sp.]